MFGPPHLELTYHIDTDCIFYDKWSHCYKAGDIFIDFDDGRFILIDNYI